MTRAIAADLERRGYIVYVTVTSAEEEHIVQSDNRADIKALWLDLSAVSAINLAGISRQTDNIDLNRHPPHHPKYTPP